MSLKSRIVQPILDQLKQGVTPQKMALTLALGVTLGVFPIIGATTLLCLVAGVLWKLNQPTIQVVNYFIYPVQIAFLPAFVRAGEFLYRAEPISFSVIQLKDEFLKSPAGFIKEFGMAGVHGITAWALVAPVAVFAIYKISLPILTKAGVNLSAGNGGSA